jgi:ABC-type polysaccharide/polyol phosphate transport system ATPase subunit
VSVDPGYVRLRDVSRKYRLLLERNQTLKETLLKRRRTVHRDLWALQDVNLDVSPGDALGVVGGNGAGKSTLLKLLAGILPPNSGTVEVGGKVVSLLELGSGFHPDFTGRENVFLNASIHGMPRKVVEEKLSAIVEFAELEGFIDAPVRTYSSGMYMRLGFAVAAELEPDVLLLDEVFAVGDAAFQSKCMSRIADFQRRGVTIVFVSHSQWAVQTVCNRAVWLSGGSIVADGHPTEVLEQYHHGLAVGGDAAAEGTSTIEDHGWRSARVSSVSVMGPSGPTARLLSGEPCTVEVTYEVVEPVSPITSITIRTVEGGLIAGTDNRVEVAPDAGAPGFRTVRFAMAELPLMEGRFAVDVRLEADAGGLVLHEVDRAVEFTVFSQGRGFGPVALPGAWGPIEA